jgi:hypothetical protein
VPQGGSHSGGRLPTILAWLAESGVAFWLHPRQVGLVSRVFPAAVSSAMEDWQGAATTYLSTRCVPAAPPSRCRRASPRRGLVLRRVICWIRAHESDAVMLQVDTRNSRVIWITPSTLPHTTTLGANGYALRTAANPPDRVCRGRKDGEYQHMRLSLAERMGDPHFSVRLSQGMQSSEEQGAHRGAEPERSHFPPCAGPSRDIQIGLGPRAAGPACLEHRHAQVI